MVRISKNEKLSVAAVLLTVGCLIVFYGIFNALAVDSNLDSNEVNNQDLNGNETQDSESLEDFQGEPDIVIEVSSNGVQPARPQLEQGDVVRFDNTDVDTVSLMSNNFDEDIEIRPDSSKFYEFSSSVFYEIHQDNELISRGSLVER